MKYTTWRNTAAIILTTSAAALSRSSNPTSFMKNNVTGIYLMMAKKSKVDKGFAQAYVFPGGGVHESDFSLKWLKLFEKAGKAEELKFPQNHNLMSHPLTYQIMANNPLPSGLPPEIGLRISAIREMFEETGILIASHKEDVSIKQSTGTCYQMEEKLGIKWRKEIGEQPNHFINLFEENDLYPNLSALHDWWAWLSPTDLPHRYYCAYFMCCIQDVPVSAADKSEVVSLEWLCPSEALQLYINNKIILHPPQIYEMARFALFSNLHELLEFTKRRSSHHSLGTWFPVTLLTKEGKRSFLLLPGDDLYPKDPDILGDRQLEKMNNIPAVVDAATKNVHRFVFTDAGIKLLCNVTPDGGHSSPDLSLLHTH